MNLPLKNLAARIAASGHAWIKPGVRVVDPRTGAAWRRTGQPAWKRDNYAAGLESERFDESTARAILAGPDLDDAATVGVLWGIARKAVHDAGFCLRRDDEPSYANDDEGSVTAFGDCDDTTTISRATTEGQRVAETLVWHGLLPTEAQSEEQSH